MNKLRLIQAGMGGMGRAWWKSVVRNSPDFDLVAIVDVADAPLAEAGDELGIPTERRFKSLGASLDAVQADVAPRTDVVGIGDDREASHIHRRQRNQAMSAPAMTIMTIHMPR